MQSKGTAQRPFKRTGLHKMECRDCGNYAYSAVAALERFGLPMCHCGSELLPDELELAVLLGVDSPAVAEYEAECQSIAHGQASHGMRGRELRPVESIAAERVSARRRERARSNRLQAIRPAVASMPF
jgi:hypothetical protein